MRDRTFGQSGERVEYSSVEPKDASSVGALGNEVGTRRGYHDGVRHREWFRGGVRADRADQWGHGVREWRYDVTGGREPSVGERRGESRARARKITRRHDGDRSRVFAERQSGLDVLEKYRTSSCGEEGGRITRLEEYLDTAQAMVMYRA